MNASAQFTSITAHNLSFATSFIIAALFLLVKALSRMTYQFLTVQMIDSIGDNGITNKTISKAKQINVFDSLIFLIDVLTFMKSCIIYTTLLTPCCEYVFINRNGKKISKLSNNFGRTDKRDAIFADNCKRRGWQ